jgi:hypothetical protein
MSTNKTKNTVTAERKAVKERVIEPERKVQVESGERIIGKKKGRERTVTVTPKI